MVAVFLKLRRLLGRSGSLPALPAAGLISAPVLGALLPLAEHLS